MQQDKKRLMGYDRTYYSSKQKTMEQLNQFAQKGLGIVV